jgi:hypothetical protein
MNREEQLLRFEELDAGRALGDLDAVEAAEWRALAADLGSGGNPCLDIIAAELELALAGKLSTPMPESVAAGVRRRFPQKRKIVLGPWLGWAVAACLMALLVFRGSTPETAPSAADRLNAMLQESGDLLRSDFSPAGDAYATAAGQVVWSDSRQEGYLTLSGLPSNDPSQKQYQLWIVDPARDEFPVDGGVFDIPSGTGPVVVPIDAKLAVKKPAAFVITLEQPGGVVRSKQEVVVALAKF